MANRYPFIQAKHFTPKGNGPVNRIVMHRAESGQRGDTAEAVAAYFRDQSTVGSAHYCADSNSVVQCVRDADRANHAAPNKGSLGIEFAGYSRDADWNDPYDQAQLRIAAGLVAEKCLEHKVPAVWLSIEDLKAGKRGITSHNNVSKAFGKSTHWDPGPGFPHDQFIALICAAMLPV